MFRFDPSWRGVYNLDRAEIYGVSLDGRTHLTDWISGNAAITWQKSKKKGDIYDTARLSNEIDYLPNWKISAGLECNLPYQSVLNLTARFVDKRKAIYGYGGGEQAPQHFKRVKLGSYTTVDLDLKVPVGKQAELKCYVENLFDKKYEELYGYPLPGVIIGTALKLSL